jgi:hypothetical protein
MLVIGGWFPASNNCDSPEVQGQHNMNLGYNGEKQALWDKYDPALSTYFVPTPVISAIGGGYVPAFALSRRDVADHATDLPVGLP